MRFCVTKARLIHKIDPYNAEQNQARIDILARAHLLLNSAAPRMWQGGRRCYANARPSSRLVELAIRTIGIELIDDDIVEALQEWDASTLGRGPNDAPRDHRATLERGSKSGKFSRRSFLLRGEIWKALVGDQSDVPDFKAWLFTRRSGDPAKAMTRLFTRYPMNAKTAKAFGEAYALIVDRLIGGNVKRTV